MPILSVYISEELFQRLEKARGPRSKSSFVASLLAEKLSEIETKPEEPEPAKPEDDPFYKLKERESILKEYQDALVAWPDPKNPIIEKIGDQLYKSKWRRKERHLDDLPMDAKDWSEDHKKRFYNAIRIILEEGVEGLEEQVEDHKLDGMRHQRLMKLVGISLKQLREMHHNFWEDHDMRDPTISEFAALIGTTYQKARNIISLLGRGYGFISEKEKRKLEAKEAEAEEA